MPPPACVGHDGGEGIAKRKGATARRSSRPDVGTLLGRFQVYQLATHIWRQHLLGMIRPVAVPVSMAMPSNRRRGRLSSRQITGSPSSFLVDRKRARVVSISAAGRQPYQVPRKPCR
jgi:hypothetical protein